MSQDQLLRLATAWTFFVLGCIAMATAYIPVHWPSFKGFVVAGCFALLLSALLSRRTFVIGLTARAPSGPVKLLKGFFAFAGAVAFSLAVLGLALFFQQAPIGSGARTYPASVLAVFSLGAFANAYLVLAGTGRRKFRRFHRYGP